MGPSPKKKLRQPSAKRRSRYALIGVVLSILFLSSSASAENPIITGITDYWFEYTEPTQFVAQTYMVAGYNSDPMLWLYNEAGTQLAANDDSYGLQSYISIQVPAGRYRLRAGICCNDPNAWRTDGGWNLQYELSFNGQPANTTSTTTTTTSTTTSTLPPTTTSTTTTTTSTLPPTTTTTVPPSTTTTSTTSTTSTTTTSSTTTSTTVPPTTTTIPPTTTSSTSTTSTTTIPVVNSTTTTTTTTVSPTTTTTTIPVILPTITAAEATAVATNAAVLATITADEATEVFDAIVLDDLTDTQLEQLVAAVQLAPPSVRASFEEEIDIFSGATDTYVPLGSTVPVKTRRALIAITTVMSVAPAIKRRN